jgi:predicted phage baseplate assembly protein
VALPVPNLDDRRFQDIVDEAKRMIPHLCPEWTNHNISDPGVALIELFAWMTDMTLFRLNQVPDRMFTQFLNLLDQRQFPAQAATADLTFWLSTATDEDVAVPGGTEVGAGDGATAVVFTTTDDLVISQPKLVAARTGNGEDGLVDVFGALRYDRDEVVCFPSSPMRSGDALYLGFDRTLAGQAIELAVATSHAAGIGIDPGRAPIVWEAWTGEHWVACTVHRDDTGGLNRDGGVQLMVPRRHEALRLGGDRHWWLRVRLVEPLPGQPTYRTSPRVSSIDVACLGGTVRAEHSELIHGELLGRSNGQPGQSFTVTRRPVLPRRGDEVVLVHHDGRATAWAEVEDFARSGPDDRHVVWDGVNGEVRFGPTIRQPDGRLVQHGAVPANGADVTVSGYRHGGGRAGNVGRGTISSLRMSIPFVDAVENLVDATAGR